MDKLTAIAHLRQLAEQSKDYTLEVAGYIANTVVEALTAMNERIETSEKKIEGKANADDHSDWDETDKSKHAYIKNKPFGKSEFTVSWDGSDTGMSIEDDGMIWYRVADVPPVADAITNSLAIFETSTGMEKKEFIYSITPEIGENGMLVLPGEGNYFPVMVIVRNSEFLGYPTGLYIPAFDVLESHLGMAISAVTLSWTRIKKIDPDFIPLEDASERVGALEKDISSLDARIANNASAISNLNIILPSINNNINANSNRIANNVAEIARNTAEITDLEQRTSVLEGIVPAPESDDKNSFLRGNGTWSGIDDIIDNRVIDLQNIKHYGARWDKTQSKMTRIYDAEGLPEDTANFCYRGTVNPDYSNPFDNIYPWSGIRLCNVDLDAYAALIPGDSITKCVKAWEGDPDFSYEDAAGVWRYRPEFWGKSWEDETYRYFDVTSAAIGSYIHYPEAIVGRWHGRVVSMTVGGSEKTCLIPSVGKPAETAYYMSTLHTYAKNYGATLDSIYSIDADLLLCVVEYANMNTQSAIGNGVTAMTRQSSDKFTANAANSNVVKVSKSAASAYCIPGAIFAIGTANGGTQVGVYAVVSAQDSGDGTNLDVTLDEPVTVTTDNYWSVRGIANMPDEEIGSRSGYIGTGSKCNAYYRGIVLFGNMRFYVLGAYKRGADNHVWIANSDEEADAYDALNTDVHYDTGIVLPSTAGSYINKLGMPSRSGLLSVPPFGIEIGGTSSNPVGDQIYNAGSNNTVLSVGDAAGNGTSAGAFCNRWNEAAAFAQWTNSARPRLKNP